jgi:hypothetical protein
MMRVKEHVTAKEARTKALLESKKIVKSMNKDFKIIKKMDPNYCQPHEYIK